MLLGELPHVLFSLSAFRACAVLFRGE